MEKFPKGNDILSRSDKWEHLYLQLLELLLGRLGQPLNQSTNGKLVRCNIALWKKRRRAMTKSVELEAGNRRRYIGALSLHCANKSVLYVPYRALTCLIRPWYKPSDSPVYSVNMTLTVLTMRGSNRKFVARRCTGMQLVHRPFSTPWQFIREWGFPVVY